MKKYSLDEIDYMRSLVGLNIKYTPSVEGWHPQWRWGPDQTTIESRLRTYMQNGTKPKEIRKELEKRLERAKSKSEQWKNEGIEREDLKEGISDLEYLLREYDAIYRNK